MLAVLENGLEEMLHALLSLQWLEATSIPLNIFQIYSKKYSKFMMARTCSLECL
jgi:hypothetical protein